MMMIVKKKTPIIIMIINPIVFHTAHINRKGSQHHAVTGRVEEDNYTIQTG